MEDQENKENEEQNLAQQVAEQGKQMAEQVIKDEAKKKHEKKLAIKLAPFIIKGVIILLIITVVLGGILAFFNTLVEIGKKIVSSAIMLVTTGDNGPLAPNPKELIEQINKELEEAGIDKDGLFLGSNLQADLYLYKFMVSALSTQLPYIKDGPEKTLLDIANISAGSTVPVINTWNTIKDKFGEVVQGIVKIKRQTGNKNIDLTYKKYDSFKELVDNNDTKALECFAIDENWMLCIAKLHKTTTKNSDGTTTEENTIEEIKMPYQQLISGYAVPFEFFITLQLISQNAEYVSAVADLVKDGEIELTIFDSTQVITTEYIYKYRVRTKWIEQKEVEKQSYTNTVSNRSILNRDNSIREIQQIAATKSQIFVGNTFEDVRNKIINYLRGQGCTSNINITPNVTNNVVWQTSSTKYTASIRVQENINQWRGQVTITDTLIGGQTTPEGPGNQEGNNPETPDPEDQEQTNPQEPGTEIIEIQRDEIGEEQTETTVRIEETNSVTAAVTKADVWVIKKETTYNNDNKQLEYPYTKEGSSTTLDDEATKEEIEGTKEGSWKVERSQTTKQIVEKNEWQIQTNTMDIDESKFLGLWKNSLGIIGLPYESNGVLVKYALPYSLLKSESPVGNILSAEEMLYDQLEKSESTQLNAQIMRYLISYYKDPETAVKPDLSIFDTNEFTDITYSSSTVKDFIHYFEGTPKELGNQYVVFDDGFGNLTVGWGIYIQKHTSRFTARGINISNLTVGSTIDKTIVDSIEDEIIEEYRSAVIQATSGLELEEYQIDALTSRVYNCGIGGGLKGFVQSYNQYGNTEELYENLLNSPITSNGKVAPGLVTRRKDEWNLFHRGYYVNTNSYYTELSGKYASTILEKSKQCHDYLRNNKYTYKQAGISVPITSSVKTVDCSSFVSWVLYEAGFTEFAGHQKTSSYFRRNPMNWQKISKANLQAGDILVYTGHVEIYAGDGKYYNCGGNSSIQAVAPSTMGKGINSSEFLFGLRP